jgi:ABC-type antimicrobial peptide transport system permease subunit
MRSHLPSDLTVSDAQEVIETIRATIVTLNIFYYFFGVVSISLCFFVLWISFTANVRENSWEFGVLRSIGLTGWQTVKIYIYEV